MNSIFKFLFGFWVCQILNCCIKFQDTLLTIGMVTREAMIVLENDLVFSKYIRRDLDDAFGVAGAKIGNVLNVRKPPRYIGRIGQGLQIEDAVETSVPLVLNTQRGVDISFTTQDLALSIDDFSERFIMPAIASVANGIDYDGLQQFVNVFNEVGTPGTVPNALLTYLQAGQRLDEQAAPRDKRRTMILSPGMQATIVDTLKGLFQSSERIAEQYDSGEMGKSIGFTWTMDQNVPTFTTGTLGGTPVVNAAGQTGNSITSSGWTASATVLNPGDVIQFAKVYAVNPQNRQSTGTLANWVVTATVTANGSGVATIPISGPGGLGIVPSGQFQDCTVSPANNATITINGASATSSPRGLAFHKDAFVLGCAELMLPGGVDMAERVTDKQLGLSIRLIRAYDINLDRLPCRLDILYGFSTLYPELASRVAS
jgi:P22 coat protein - gene protein 5